MREKPPPLASPILEYRNIGRLHRFQGQGTRLLQTSVTARQPAVVGITMLFHESHKRFQRQFRSRLRRGIGLNESQGHEGLQPAEDLQCGGLAVQDTGQSDHCWSGWCLVRARHRVIVLTIVRILPLRIQEPSGIARRG